MIYNVLRDIQNEVMNNTVLAFNGEEMNVYCCGHTVGGTQPSESGI